MKYFSNRSIYRKIFSNYVYIVILLSESQMHLFIVDEAFHGLTLDQYFLQCIRIYCIESRAHPS